jgi:hypothetical protein
MPGAKDECEKRSSRRNRHVEVKGGQEGEEDGIWNGRGEEERQG